MKIRNKDIGTALMDLKIFSICNDTKITNVPV